MSHCERLNRYVFSLHLNAASDIFSRKAGGRLFHTAGPLYAKLRCPVEVWTRGSEMQLVDADRRRGWPRTSSTGTQSFRRYVGATPLTHFHAITADLKVTRRRTGSQWRLHSIIIVLKKTGWSRPNLAEAHPGLGQNILQCGWEPQAMFQTYLQCKNENVWQFTNPCPFIFAQVTLVGLSCDLRTL